MNQNLYPIAIGDDTSGLSLNKIKPLFTTKAVVYPISGAAIGAMLGGKKHRALGAAVGVGAVIGLLYIASPLG